MGAERARAKRVGRPPREFAELKVDRASPKKAVLDSTGQRNRRASLSASVS